jgi:hypothetical protein
LLVAFQVSLLLSNLSISMSADTPEDSRVVEV